MAIEYIVHTIENILLTSYKYFISGRITSIFWDIYVGPKKLWPWPAFTLGPKARTEEGSEVSLKERAKAVQERFWEKLKISMLIGKGTLDSTTTKDKGKAVITAIEHSAPDRAILFCFYNHSQPLWVWADGTSISPGKSNLHVNVG